MDNRVGRGVVPSDLAGVVANSSANIASSKEFLGQRDAQSIGSCEGYVKLIIQIPCLNEEATVPETLAALPRKVSGFTEVEWLVINDGSTDRTVELARQYGVQHIVGFSHNRGLVQDS
jgi:cellulose synthase/poly-beta-1,6-N-acetylglucosamine synthase-like glycosyltransferase